MSLDKLTLFENGSCKLPVGRTEGDTSVGTLIVQLPSEFKGGGLVVRTHKSHEQKHEFTGMPCTHSSPRHKESLTFTLDASFTFNFAAFRHECNCDMLPISEGYNLALIYKLFQENAGTL